MLSTQSTTSYSCALYYCPPNDSIQHKACVPDKSTDICTIEVNNEKSMFDYESIIFHNGYYIAYIFTGSKILNLGNYMSKKTAEYAYTFCKTKNYDITAMKNYLKTIQVSGGASSSSLSSSSSS